MKALMRTVICGILLFGCHATYSFSPEYSNALIRASMPNTSERVCTNLIRIQQDNTNLTWWSNSSTNMVLVASFMSEYAATSYYKTGWGGLSYGESWVTTVPELQNFCIDYTNSTPQGNLSARCEQRLGMWTSTTHTHVVEYYVEAKYIARPAPDNEITDSQSAIDFGFTNQVQAIFPIPINTDYYAWFTNNQANTYNPANSWAAPWSRLGYTWDWAYTNENASASNSIIGFSEFIIAGGTYYNNTGSSVPIYVVTITNITAYGSLSDTPSIVETVDPSGSLTNQFTAMWNPATRATEYILDVATDTNFTSFVDGFSNKAVVASTQCTVSPLDAGTYYYRVRAVSPNGQGAYSESQEVNVSSSRRSALSWLMLLFE